MKEGVQPVIMVDVDHSTLVSTENQGDKEMRLMKQGIHPEYKKATIKCACGNEFETGSVKESIRVEICSECHPFFTDKQRFADRGGRVDRFKKKYNLK